MKLKYLLTMDCDERGYWDTGYCHSYPKSYHERGEFDLDDEEGLIKGIACFIEEYPQGEYEIYIICDYMGWYDGNPEWETGQAYEEKIDRIKTDAFKISKEIAEQKRLKQIEEENKQKAKEQERIKQQELKKLEELKAKYEKGN